MFLPPILQDEVSAIPLNSLYDLLKPITLPAGSASFTNWGQTFTCTPLSIFEPVDERQCALILELARREGKTVRAVGVGHSPSDLACTSGYMVQTMKLDKIIEVCVRLLSPSIFASLPTSRISNLIGAPDPHIFFN